MKQRLDQFCNIGSSGQKIDAINMVFEMLQKVSKGDLHVDKSINQFNHFKQGTLFAIANIVVDSGIVNHPFLAESYHNLMEETPPTEMNTAGVDNINGVQFKKCAPSLSSWETVWAAGGSANFGPSSLKTEEQMKAKRYVAKLYNPMYRGDHYATLDIPMVELLRLNPQWTNPDLKYRSISIGVDKTGDISLRCKYNPYITLVPGLIKGVVIPS